MFLLSKQRVKKAVFHVFLPLFQALLISQVYLLIFLAKNKSEQIIDDIPMEGNMCMVIL